MDSASLPLILLAAAPVLKIIVWRGKKSKTHKAERNALHLCLVPVWYDSGINRTVFLIICRDLRFRGKKQMRKHFDVFVETAFRELGAACSTCFHEKNRRKKPNAFFLLSLKRHERSTESACRGWDSAESYGAQQQSPTSHNCPKPHPVQKEKTCTFSSGGTHALMWSQLPMKQCCSSTRTSQPGRSHPAVHIRSNFP